MHNLRLTMLASALVLTWIVATYHATTFAPPPAEKRQAREGTVAKSYFLPRSIAGINNLVLFGTPYERGLATGRLTHTLLAEEETDLISALNQFFPNPLVRWGIIFGAMRWFWGIDPYLYSWATEEMYGVSAASSHDFDRLADPFTRQVAYHGVHEIGQMFVDFERQDFGCTAIGVPWHDHWLIGRNFDFEAVRLLDTEKLLKWTFPDQGHSYVSVIWAGMVGVVTGINDHGVYVSINAAGTSDFRRYGTPTTLVALKALQEANSASEAVAIIEAAQVFISDLFVVSDQSATGFYVIEKTPKRFKTTLRTAASAVTNHFTSAEFQDDAINRFRMREQTSVSRYTRANELAATWEPTKHASSLDAAAAVVAMLRDKHAAGGEPLPLGNRQAIDALIATHSVVYDAASQDLWVSQGPALVGGYIGYDLRASFLQKRPVEMGRLPNDPDIGTATFWSMKAGQSKLKVAKLALKEHKCVEASRDLRPFNASPISSDAEYLMTLGDYFRTCANDPTQAQTYWRRALAAHPAYLRHRTYLTEALR